MNSLWPHQTYGISETLAAFLSGARRVCLTSPTGGGKTRMLQEIALDFLRRGQRVALYSNRTYLIEQLSASLIAAGIDHGIRAASSEDDERERPLQITSVQTEGSRVLKRKTDRLHACQVGDLAVIDEAHLHSSGQAVEIIGMHSEAGAKVLGLTATPMAIGDIYERLIIAGYPSELRACGALVEARHYGCDEPDMKAFKNAQEGQDPSSIEQRKAIMTPTIMARVWKWYERLNQFRRSCLLFGPGVEESLWFAEQFAAKGVPSAHIDGDDVWLDGEMHRSSPQLRDEIRRRSKDGSIKVVCNRYVLREGIDWPWIEHVILAFVAGSLQTYLQIGGRGLRAYPGKTECIIQDHGGAWWKHGSLNEDRAWNLAWTPEIAYGLRADRLRNKKCEKCKEPLGTARICPACGHNNGTEPRICPQCGRVLADLFCNPAWGGCGHKIQPEARRSRPVVSTDGEMKELAGDVFKPRHVFTRPDGPAIWERMYYRSKTKKGERTFRAAMVLFALENNWGWPDPKWPFMPVDPLDFYRLVSAVEMERLVPKC